MERVSGPFEEFFIATYTVPTSEGHVAFSKACKQRPGHVWDGTPGILNVVAGPCESEVLAILFGVDKALAELTEAGPKRTG